MILSLGSGISVESRDVVAIVPLGDGTDAGTRRLVAGAKRERRVLSDAPTARSLVLCAGARRPGGVSENARLYLSPFTARRLAARAAGALFDSPRLSKE